MELFEEIRREHRDGAGSIRAIAKKLGVHRRMVRQALAGAVPQERKKSAREQPKLGLVKEVIDTILERDRKAPRKQRHTAPRIWVRIRRELPEAAIAESTVRRYVGWKRHEMGQAGWEVYIAQSYAFGDDYGESGVMVRTRRRSAFGADSAAHVPLLALYNALTAIRATR